MGKPKNHFLFNLEWEEILSELPREVKHEVYDAIIEYAKSGKLLDLKPIAKGCFLFIRKEMDYYSKQYQRTVDVRREAGSKGGKATSIKRKQAEADAANAAFAEQTEQAETNAAEYDNEYDNDNDSEDKSSSSPPAPQGVNEEEEGLREKIEEYKSKPIWKQSVWAKFHLKPEEIDGLLDEFYLDMRCREINVRNMSSFFTGWLMQKQKGDESKRSDKPNGGSRSKLPPEPDYGLIED